jgi:hypothetical protein
MSQDPSQNPQTQASTDVKTEGGDTNTINVKVRVYPSMGYDVALSQVKRQVVSSTGEEVFFKIKRTTKLSKLQGAYANKVGKDVSSIRCVLIRPARLSRVSDRTLTGLTF